MWLIVGLGNPGPEYAGHRHNVGFMVADLLARITHAERFRSKFSAAMARTTADGEEAILLKPMTFMNCSGDAVQPCAAFFKIPIDRVVVIHDELDLPFEDVRVKKGGGHAGHNGVRSLIERLGTGDFVRVRIGIGRPGEAPVRVSREAPVRVSRESRGDASDWVLSNFSAEEREKLPTTLERAAKSVLDIAVRGVDAAMKATNTRPKEKPARD